MRLANSHALKCDLRAALLSRLLNNVTVGTRGCVFLWALVCSEHAEKKPLSDGLSFTRLINFTLFFIGLTRSRYFSHFALSVVLHVSLSISFFLLLLLLLSISVPNTHTLSLLQSLCCLTLVSQSLRSCAVWLC